MKLFCLQENLKNSLSVVEKLSGQNLNLPILSNILLAADNNQLKLTTTNLETAIITWLPSKIEQKGEICVPLKILNGFINNINNGKIEIELKDNILRIKKDNYEVNILTLDTKNFPIIPKVKKNKKIILKQRNLKEGLGQVLNCAATTDLKPEITGIYFNFKKDNFKLAATDSFRLAEKRIKTEDQTKEVDSFILPIKTSQELSRILKDSEDDVCLYLDENQVLFEFDNIQIFSKLIDGQYPNYEQIIPNDFKTKTILKKQDFLNSLKIASLFCGKTNDIILKVNKNSVEIISQNSEKGENKSEITAKNEGPSLEIVFNYRYLIDGLNNIADDEIVLNFNEKNSPTRIFGLKEKGYNYIIMPIRSV